MWMREEMLQFERIFWQDGVQYIAGVDEVGRGCMCGDVVAAAVILPVEMDIPGVMDSKKISEKKREALFEVIMQQAVAVGVGRVDAATIDRINIKQASRLAMRIAVEQLQVPAQALLVDAEKVDLPLPQQAIIKGDARSVSIAAASIIAKVTRDRLCTEWEAQYPGYGIAVHKGYGTALHRKQYAHLGASPIHRQSFLSKWNQEGGGRDGSGELETSD
jgi:ribonuclease HII